MVDGRFPGGARAHRCVLAHTTNGRAMVAIAVFTNPRGERCDAIGVDIERFDDPFAELLADVDAQRAGEILRRLVRDRSPR
jgi:hypothetical protein